MKNLFKKRRKTRKLTLQGLYSLYISKNNIINIEKYILSNNNTNKIDIKYLKLLLKEIPLKQSLLNDLIETHTNKKIKELNYIDLIILQIALFELLFCKNIPYKVVINEALELSKIFSSKFSYIFINKILDILTKKLR